MGIEALAASIVGNVLVPYITKGIDALTTGLADKVGESAAGGVAAAASRIVARVKEAFAQTDDAPVLDQLERRPEKAAPLATEALTEILRSDPALADELQLLLDQRPEGTGGQSVGTIIGNLGYVDARGGHFENTQLIGQVVGTMPPAPPAGA